MAMMNMTVTFATTDAYGNICKHVVRPRGGSVVHGWEVFVDGGLLADGEDSRDFHTFPEALNYAQWQATLTMLGAKGC